MQQRPDNTPRNSDDRNSRDSSDQADAARAERNRRYDAVRQQVDEAWNRQAWREVLQLLEKQKKLRNGPVVRDSIARVKAFIVWTEARTAKERRRAIAMNPAAFSADNIRYVEELEAQEKYERERPKREARAMADYERGIKALGQNDPVTAEKYFRAALDNKPNDALLARNLEVAQERIRLAAGARQTELNNQAALELTRLGNAAMAGQQDLAAALRYFEEAVRKNPNEPQYQKNLESAQLAVRLAEDVKVATRIREKFSEFAASLDTDAPQAGLVATRGGPRGAAAGFETYKADAPLRFGDPSALENLSEQGQQGFDDDRRLKGSRPVPADGAPVATAVEMETAPVTIPEKFRDNPKIVEFQSQWKEARKSQAAAEQNLADLRELRTKPDANKEELDVKEVDIRMKLDAAKSQQATAVVQITETMRTFTESKLD